MVLLILGLIVFLAAQSSGIYAPAWREATLLRLGRRQFMATSGALSLIGLIAIVWGYTLAGENPVVLRVPSPAARNVAIGLNFLAFILLGLSVVPAGRIRAWFRHALPLAIGTWALAHLLANGTLAGVILFGSFLVWSGAQLGRAVAEDRRVSRVWIPGPWINDLTAVAVGLVLFLLFFFYLHRVLIGVSPVA